MSRFKKIMEAEGCTFENDEMKPENPGRLKNRFDFILNAVFTDILEKKSEIFRDMVSLGLDFDFSKSVKMPDEIKKIEYQDFYQKYMGDMK